MKFRIKAFLGFNLVDKACSFTVSPQDAGTSRFLYRH